MSMDASTGRVGGRIAKALRFGDAFQVLFVFGDLSVARTAVSDAVGRASRESKLPVDLRWFLPDDAADGEHPELREAISVWVTELHSSGHEAKERLRRLNRTRDSMARRGRTTLVILLDEAQGALPAEHAPDLWSVRSFSLSVADDEESAPHVARLLGWSADCDDAIARKLSNRRDIQALYARGTYRFSYQVRNARPMASVAELQSAMGGIRGWTGWRPWWVPQNARRPYSADDGVVECWMVGAGNSFDDPAHADFWRASTDGRFYLLRGYGEDSTEKQTPGMVFSMSLPVWRVAEALLHAKQVSEVMSAGPRAIDFSATWTGLKGRTLVDWPSRYLDALDFDHVPTERESVTSVFSTDADELSSQLAEVVRRALQPLYDAFMTTLSVHGIERELGDLLGRPVRG